MYYLISIQQLQDDTRPVAIFGYETEKAAMSAYYSTLASNYANANLKFFSVTIMTDLGAVRIHDDYTA